MDATHTLLLLLGLVVLWQPSVTAQLWPSPPPAPPQGGERLDSLHSVLPLVQFECRGRTQGYYGDMDFGCIVFHFCAQDGKRFSFKCDEGMKFNEVTTSCSVGYFGDCSHPHIVRDKPTKPANTDTTVKVPGFIRKAEREGTGEDHEPFIHHREPTRDSHHDHNDAHDQGPDASNRVARTNNNIKRSSELTPMMSALSAFASLANVPLDNAMLAQEHREGRAWDPDHAHHFDAVDRSFVARPSPHHRTPLKQSSVGFMTLSFPQTDTKKGRDAPHRAPPRAQAIIKTHHRRPHTRPDAQDPYFEPPSLFQRPPQPYLTGTNYDLLNDDHYDLVQGKAAADSFRPSSLLNSGLEDEFRPVETGQSQATREDDDLVRPHRDAQVGRGAVSSTFQNFSPRPSTQSSAGRFQGQNPFARPASSNRPVQGNPSGFVGGSRFPSTGSFSFNQPPVPTLVTRNPFHHVQQSGSGFRGNNAPHFQTQGSFGFQHQPNAQPQPGQTIVRQTLPQPGRPFIPQLQPQPQAPHSFGQSSTQTFGRPNKPQPVQIFNLPEQPRSPQSVFGQGFNSPDQPRSPPSVFGQGFTSPEQPRFPPSAFGQGFTSPEQPRSPPSAFGQGFTSPEQPRSPPSAFGQGFTSPEQPRSPPSAFGQGFTSPEQPRSPPSAFGQGFTSQPSVFNTGVTPPTPPPKPVQTFDRPYTAPQPFNVFSLASVPLPTTDSFGRQTPRPTPSQPNTPEHNTFRSASPTPFSVTTLRPHNDFDSGRTELQQESPLGQDIQRHQQPAPPARRPTRPSTPSRAPQHSSRNPDSTFQDHSRGTGNPDPQEEFGRPLKNRPRGRPTGTRRQNTRRRPVTSSTEKPVQRRPSRTRQPTRPPVDPAPPRTVDQGERRPLSQPDDEPPHVPRIQPQPLPQVTEQDSFIHTTPFAPHTQETFTQFPSAFDHQPEEHFQQSPGAFDLPTGFSGVSDGFPHFDNDLQPDFDFGSASRGVQGEGLSAAEGVEEDTNIIVSHVGDPFYTADEEVQAPTPSPIPDTTTPETTTPPRRRRPSIRTRLRPRVPPSRSTTTTTTPLPETFRSEDDLQNDYEYSDDSLATTTQSYTTEETLTATTTLSPFRQRVKDRLNRLKNKRGQNQSSRSTTRQPSSERSPSRGTSRQLSSGRSPSRSTTSTPSFERSPSPVTTSQPSNDRGFVRLTGTRRNDEDESHSDQITTTTTASTPRRRPLRPRGLDRSRYQSFRNKLRSRLRNRLSTTETPQGEEDTTNTPETTEEDISASGGRARGRNRFGPRTGDSKEESVLVVKEILRSSDQDVQATTDLKVSQQEQHEGRSEGGNSPAFKERFGEKHKAEESIVGVQEEGEASHPRSQEGDTPVRFGFQGRRLADPNLRARFRQFLKNKLSARHRTTNAPEISEEPQRAEDAFDELTAAATDVELRQWTGGPPRTQHDADETLHVEDKASLPHHEQEEQGEEQPHDKALSLVLKERGEKFEQRRKELRTKLLARRGDERFSRKVLVRPSKNQVPNEALTKDVDQLTPERSQDPPTFEETRDSEDPAVTWDKRQPFKETRNSEDPAVTWDKRQPFEETRDSEDPAVTWDKRQPFESPVQKVISIDGFRPIIETAAAPPTPLHPRPFLEPEIITAPPPQEQDDGVMLFKVSAILGGTEQQKQVTKLPFSDLPPPSTMIVREIGSGLATSPAPPSPASPASEAEAREDSASQDTVEENLAEQQEGSESQNAPVLISVQTVSDKTLPHPDEELSFTSATTTPTQPPSVTTTPAQPSSPSPSPTQPSSPTQPPSPSTSPSPTPLPETPTTSSPAPAEPKRASRPSFNLAAALRRRSSMHKERRGDSAHGGAAGVSVTPRPQLTITMATDEPLLPLEMLLRLTKSR